MEYRAVIEGYEAMRDLLAQLAEGKVIGGKHPAGDVIIKGINIPQSISTEEARLEYLIEQIKPDEGSSCYDPSCSWTMKYCLSYDEENNLDKHFVFLFHRRDGQLVVRATLEYESNAQRDWYSLFKQIYDLDDLGKSQWDEPEEFVVHRGFGTTPVTLLQSRGD